MADLPSREHGKDNEAHPHRGDIKAKPSSNGSCSGVPRNAIDNCFDDEEAVDRWAAHVARVCSIAGDSRSLHTLLGLLLPCL